jgi:hypothetical protein
MNTSVFDRFGQEGLIKVTDSPQNDIGQTEKVSLIRKGNELFNKGDIESARRVFMTTGYSDGLIRVGDSYYKAGRTVEALKMYWLAKDRRRAAELIEKMALVIQNLLREEDQNGGRDDAGKLAGAGGAEPRG